MILLALLLAQSAQGAAPYTAPAVPDPVLADERGGFRLPNGIDVALTVQTDTAVNGALVLRTVFRADQGSPTLSSYLPQEGQTVAIGRAAGGGTAQTAPTISFDARGGIQVTPGIATVAAAVGTSQDVAVAAADLRDAGDAVTRDTSGAVRTVTLAGGDLSVTHFAGNAFGSAIANTGSNRAIDTATSVSIDLGQAGPDVLGSAMLRVEGVAVEALRMRTP